MSQKIHRRDLDKRPTLIPIEQGGSGADNLTEAAVNLDLITQAHVNVANGIAGLDAGGNILPEHIPGTLVLGSVKVQGPSIMYVGTQAEWTITDFDQYTTYTVTAADGFVSRAQHRIHYTAPMTPGTHGFTINGKVIAVVVDDHYIEKPIIINPLEDALHNNSSVIIKSSAFTVVGGYPQTTLTAGDKAANDEFGMSIALDATGSRMAVGARDKTVDGITGAGQVYIYTRAGAVWTQESTLTAVDAATGDFFGGSVALDGTGERLVVGASQKTIAGVVGAGKVYIYTRVGAVWTLENTIILADKATGDWFGVSVALDATGTRLATAAHVKVAGGVAGAGNVYIYTRSGTTWTLETTLSAADKAANDQFGRSVALDAAGTRLAVSAYNKTVGGVTGAGQVYIYTRSGTTWTQETTLSAADKATNDYFGTNVAIDDNGLRLVVGAYNKTVADVVNAGKVYLYTRVGSVWTLESTLTASDKVADDWFGTGLALSADGAYLSVGAIGRDVTGLTNAGQVYIYDMTFEQSADWQLSTDAGFGTLVVNTANDTTNLLSYTANDLVLNTDYYARVRYTGSQYGTSEWSEPVHFKTRAAWLPGNEISILNASDKAAIDQFGVSVALDATGSRMVIGTNGKTVGGVTQAGQVYVYTRSGTVWTLETTLSAADKVAYDYFGVAVALDATGSRLAVGAHGREVGGVADTGQVYVYTRSGSVWTQESTLSAADKASTDRFGAGVALDAAGTRLAVGAYNKTVGGVGGAGQVYIYTRSGAVWTLETTLSPADKATNDYFGGGVTLDAAGSRLAVGAYGKTVGGVTSAGQVYVYTRSGTTWTQESTLSAADKATNDQFGVGMALDAAGTRLAVGAYNKTITGVIGAGQVYLYTRSGATWILESVVMASNKVTNALLGRSLAITSNSEILATGAYGTAVGGLANAGVVHLYN